MHFGIPDFDLVWVVAEQSWRDDWTGFHIAGTCSCLGLGPGLCDGHFIEKNGHFDHGPNATSFGHRFGLVFGGAYLVGYCNLDDSAHWKHD